MPDLARLHSGTFYVRERDGELWNCLRLRMATPRGDQAWDTGWGSLEPDRGYDDLPVDVDLSEALRAFIEA